MPPIRYLGFLTLLSLGGCFGGPRFDPGPGWTRTPIVNGFEYRSPRGSVRVLEFVDEHMDQKVLFSQQTRRNVKENYEETYAVGDDHVYFTSLPLAGRESLVVFFADRSGGAAVHKRQYYVVDGHRVLVITGTVGEGFTSAQLDDFVAQALD